MQLLALTITYALTGLTALVEDPVPADDDVVAGGWGALMFGLLVLAMVVLSFSLVKQLRRAQAAKNAGVYGDQPATRESDDRANGDRATDGAESS